MLNIFIRGFFTFFLNHFFFLSVINKYINLIRGQLDYNSIEEPYFYQLIASYILKAELLLSKTIYYS